MAVKGRLVPRLESLPRRKSKLLRPESNENLASDTGGGRKGRGAEGSLAPRIESYGTDEKEWEGLWPGLRCLGGDGGGGMSREAWCWSLEPAWNMTGGLDSAPPDKEDAVGSIDSTGGGGGAARSGGGGGGCRSGGGSTDAA